MKKTRKLIPAIVMLLVSAVMMSTASFAWFSMNTSVTANNMQVTATAPSSLLISTTSATSGFGSSVTLYNDTEGADASFVPVAYAGVCASWYELTDTAAALVNEAGTFTGQVTDGSEASAFVSTLYETSTSIYHDTVWLKAEGKTGTGVTATVAYDNSPSSEIKKAMHVVFVVGNVVKATVDMGETSLTTTELADLTANANGTRVDIYYFLSGNDIDCKNSNITTADATLSVDITFTAADLTGSN